LTPFVLTELFHILYWKVGRLNKTGALRLLLQPLQRSWQRLLQLYTLYLPCYSSTTTRYAGSVKSTFSRALSRVMWRWRVERQGRPDSSVWPTNTFSLRHSLKFRCLGRCYRLTSDDCSSKLNRPIALGLPCTADVSLMWSLHALRLCVIPKWLAADLTSDVISSSLVDR